MLCRFNAKGQSKLEYAFLYITIFIAMFLMGPYILRATTAFFQSIDEDVQDTFDDPLLQLEQPWVEEGGIDIPIVIPER